jgi:hypothetical protein
MPIENVRNFTPSDPGTPDSLTLDATRLAADEAAARILGHGRRSSP